MPRPLARRTLLRGLLAGAAVSVALPPLEAMLNPNGDALADGSDLPTRFGIWFWGNGIRPEAWVPRGEGTNFGWSELLEPLDPVKERVSILTGMNVRGPSHPHHSGICGVLTGDTYHKLRNVRDTIATTFNRASVDQLMAAEFEGQAPFRSLEVGITRFRGTDEGSTFQHISHNGPNDPNPSEYSASALYRRLFGGPAGAAQDLVRVSVLDAVTDQIRDLDRRVGTSDRARLDRHLTSVRELELRLASERGACLPPDRPIDPIEGTNEPIAQKNAIMSELLALALTCDLTRVFTVQFSAAGAGVVFWQVGAVNGLHYTCHTETLPQPVVRAATRLTMQQLATFLETLQSTPEGPETLLDRCAIVCTSDLSDGRTHLNTEYPMILAGRGGGRLVSGQHLRIPGQSVTRAVLTAMQGAGSSARSFGTGPGYTDRPLTELLA